MILNNQTYSSGSLVRYAQPETKTNDSRHQLAMVWTPLLLCLLLGWALSAMDVPSHWVNHQGNNQAIKVSLDAFRPPEKPSPIVEPMAEPIPELIPVLDAETILQAPDEKPRLEEPKSAPVVQPNVAQEPAATAPARRIYGVRKIYAQGLGSSSEASGGLVTKRGNTLNGRRDTLTATEADLQGELAALSSVDQAPQPVHRVKPEYSEAMLSAQVRGEVTAYLLVDVDGSVQDVKITEDIGHDSRQVAARALRQFRFKPASRQGQPVAVWILHRIRFEFQQ